MRGWPSWFLLLAQPPSRTAHLPQPTGGPRARAPHTPWAASRQVLVMSAFVPARAKFTSAAAPSASSEKRA
eukprot:8731768-Pyramimonas_sp.AAC.1